MSVVIIDYGSGNLRSAAKALERASGEAGLRLSVKVTARPEEVAKAEHIVLPGVGAFADCRHGLESLPGMIAALEERVLQAGRPFLGICVGMQLLAERGLEHGEHRGLAWMPGEVVPLTPDRPGLKVPHMGWNALEIRNPAHPLFTDMPNGTYMYFVHSYHFRPGEPAHLLAGADYGGSFAAVVGRDNLIGTQFHPEKSQRAGLAFLARFLGWRP
jgi:glutamine amidotransferase